MSTWPDDIDVHVFKGRVVEQVCFAANVISIAFNEGLAMHACGGLSHTSGGETRRIDLDRELVCESRLMRLVEQRVSRPHVADDELCLEFENGDRLVFHCDFGGESYQMTVAGRTYYV